MTSQKLATLIFSLILMELISVEPGATILTSHQVSLGSGGSKSYLVSGKLGTWSSNSYFQPGQGNRPVILTPYLVSNCNGSKILVYNIVSQGLYQLL